MISSIKKKLNSNYNKNIFNKKNFYKENFQPNKPVFIFTGHLRNYLSIIEFTKKFIKKYKANVIVSVWDAKNTDIEILKKNLRPIYIETQKYNFILTKSILGKKNLLDAISLSAPSTRGQIYKFCRSIDILKNIEKNLNNKFYLILKSRLDLLFLVTPNLLRKKNTIFFENTFGDWGNHRSDRFFYGDRNYLINFEKKLRNYSYHIFQKFLVIPRNNQVPLNEALLKNCCDNYKINSYPIFPLCAIWRSRSKPNLNDYLKIFKYFLKRVIKRKIFMIQA